jgi:hypothetical protein
MQAMNKKIDVKGLIFIVLLVVGAFLIQKHYENQIIVDILSSEVALKIVIFYVILGYLIERIYVNPPKNWNFDFSGFCDFVINFVTYIVVTSSGYTLVKAVLLQYLTSEIYFKDFGKLDLAAVLIVSFSLLIKYIYESSRYYLNAIYNTKSVIAHGVVEENPF